jgi:hypothetical protein
MESSKGSFRRSPAKPTDENADVQGLGQEWQIEEAAKSGGAKSTVNYASAVISLRTKDSQQSLGKFLVSQFINDDAAMYTAALDSIEIDGKNWRFGLRFRRNYKDYKVLLDDVILEQYTGTAKPKDYSSFVKIENDEGSTVQQGRIWMNNPMRFRGETFYQSGYLAAEMSPNGVEQTTLQVVTNAGWLIPYVACVLSGLGMLVHFGGTFARFASRYDRSADLPASEPAQEAKLTGEKVPSGKQKKAMAAKPKVSSRGSLVSIVVPVLFCGLAALYVGRNAMIPNQDRDEINWYAIGEIPTQYGGRIKPLASASAEFLEILSNKKFALSKEGHQYEPEQKTGKEIDSVTWIMAVFAREPWVLEAPLIRIDAPEITTALGLKRHKSNRYSHQEIRLGLSKIMDQVKSLFETKREAWSFEQEKLGEVIEKISAIENLLDAYTPLAPRISDKPEEMQAAIEQLQFDADRIRARSPLAVIPPLFTPPAEPGMKAPPAKWEGLLNH